MILKNRLFERALPARDARVFYIFCEGRSREYDYFRYFQELNSRIALEIVRPETDDNNSPSGLYQKACSYIIKTEENSNPKYELSDVDEVWFVIDTDNWSDKISYLRGHCADNKSHADWFVAQSNPCFEVWLYYHICDEKPDFETKHISKEWKTFMNNSCSGGFDSRKHPIFIGRAIDNARNNYTEKDGVIGLGSTEVYKLSERFYPFIQSIIEEGLRKTSEEILKKGD